MVVKDVNVSILNPAPPGSTSEAYASSGNNFSGNLFGFSNGPLQVMTIPCRVQITPDTEEMRTRLRGRVRIDVSAIADSNQPKGATRMSWDHPFRGQRRSGQAVYDPIASCWTATVTFVGLPEPLPHSRGRVPAKLGAPLFGEKTITVSILNDGGTRAIAKTTASYQVYFGDSVVIGGVPMAETIENYQKYIKHLTVPGEAQNVPAFSGDDVAAIRGLEDPIRREIFMKMNCAREAFVFESLEAAVSSFTARRDAIKFMREINAHVLDADYFNEQTGVHPRAGATVFHVQGGTAGGWVDGRYWEPEDAKDPWCWEFHEETRTDSFNAEARVFPFRGECAGALQICTFMAVAGALGAKGFDSIHPQGSLEIGPWGAAYRKHSGPVMDYQTMIPGDYAYIKNKDDYSTIDPSGSWTGENCIYIGEDSSGTARFSGMGLDNMTEAQLRAALKKAYDKDCAPRKVQHPQTEIRFTEMRRLIVEPRAEAAARKTVTTRPAPARVATGKLRAETPARVSRALLQKEGFALKARDTVVRSEIRLGDLGKTLGFDIEELRPVPSSSLRERAHFVKREGTTCVVNYLDENAPTHDENSVVQATVRLAPSKRPH